MNESSINPLLEDLKIPDETVRQRQLKNSGEPGSAKGMYGWELLQRSQVLFEAGKIIQAEEVLYRTAQRPAGLRKLGMNAVLYYTEQYEKISG